MRNESSLLFSWQLLKQFFTRHRRLLRPSLTFGAFISKAVKIKVILLYFTQKSSKIMQAIIFFLINKFQKNTHCKQSDADVMSRRRGASRGVGLSPIPESTATGRWWRHQDHYIAN